eukprot:scaffold22080_cov125-Isochrysis_galbana.AAC.1
MGTAAYPWPKLHGKPITVNDDRELTFNFIRRPGHGAAGGEGALNGGSGGAVAGGGRPSPDRCGVPSRAGSGVCSSPARGGAGARVTCGAVCSSPARNRGAAACSGPVCASPARGGGSAAASTDAVAYSQGGPVAADGVTGSLPRGVNGASDTPRFSTTQLFVTRVPKEADSTWLCGLFQVWELGARGRGCKRLGGTRGYVWHGCCVACLK